MKSLSITSNRLTSTTSTVRSSLQKSSLLKNLDSGGHWEDFSHKMIIPGGMTFKEKAYFNLTGNYPKSVMERWYEAGSETVKANIEDDVVQIGSHISDSSNFDIHNISDTTISSNHDDEGFFSKLTHLFTGDN